jgi:hypothetical protein
MDRFGLYGGYIAANVLKWYGGALMRTVFSGGCSPALQVL